MNHERDISNAENIEVVSTLLIDAIREGTQLIRAIIEKGTRISTYHEWTSLSVNKNKVPSLNTSHFSGPPEYRNCFHSYSGTPAIIESEVESFKTFVKFVVSDLNLLEKLNPFKIPVDEYKTHDLRDSILLSIIKDGIERYLHIYKDEGFSEANAKIIVDQILNYYFATILDIDIVVPILFIDFEFNSWDIGNNIEIRRLTELEQMSRASVKSTNASVSEHVLSSASHAVVFKNWEVKNTDNYSHYLHDINTYPLAQIDKFFAAIRIVKPIDTGYAQVLAVAKSWFHHCKADLPHIEGVSTRSYSSKLEDYYWNVPALPMISGDEMKKIADIFNRLYDCTENAINLSIKRLNQCLIREAEEDSVLDATIAFEALLSDDGNQEMTHKLAMRVAALAKFDISFDKTPQEAFKDIKAIYSHRSAIVHGSKNLSKKRVLRLADNTEITTLSLAIEYLRFVLSTLVKNPEFRTPQIIDQNLLLGKK